MPTVRVPATFNSLTAYDAVSLFNESISDTPGEAVPASLTWKGTFPYSLAAFSAAADVGGNPRIVDSGCTILSPHYGVGAFHIAGTKFYWLQDNGTEINRTVESSTRIGATDVVIYRWDTPITTIDPLPVLLHCGLIGGRQCLALEADRHLNLRRMNNASSSSPANVCLDTDTQLTCYRTAAQDDIESGDSGKPAIIVVNGLPALTITAFSSATTVSTFDYGIGPNPTFYISAINAILAGDAEALTVLDLIPAGQRGSLLGSILPSLAGSLAGVENEEED